MTNVGGEDDERATFRVEEMLDRVGQLVVSVPRPAVGNAPSRGHVAGVGRVEVDAVRPRTQWPRRGSDAPSGGGDSRAGRRSSGRGPDAV